MPRRCPSCGTEAAAPDARHCHLCGTPLPSEDSGSGAQRSVPDAGSPSPSAPQRSPGAAQPGRPPGSGASRHPSGLPDDVRNMAMLAHLSALAALFLGGFSFLGPLIVWLVKRDMHPFVDEHGREALNFNLSVLIYAIISVVLVLVLVGIVLIIALFVFWLVVTIIGAVRASNGQSYRYPLCIRFIT